MKIGVLALQGAFREHANILQTLGAETQLVKRDFQLEGLDGLVIPGGESTAIGKLLREYSLLEPLRDMAKRGFPVFGTCAGMIVMAKALEGPEEPHLAIMDIIVNRNSFGRQRESFEADLDMPVLGAKTFPAVFIRAPHVVQVGEGVAVLCSYEGRVVAAQQNHMLALSFHPELTGDSRIHRYFLEMVEAAKR